MSKFKEEEKPATIKSRWLVYRKNGEGTYECINHATPFNTMEQAENFARACDPWTKPFLRCFFDIKLEDWDNA